MNYFEANVEQIKTLQKQLLVDLFDKIPHLETIKLEFGYYDGEVCLEAVNGSKITGYLDLDDFRDNSDEIRSWLVENSLTVDELKSICAVISHLRYCDWFKDGQNDDYQVTHYRNQYIQAVSC